MSTSRFTERELEGEPDYRGFGTKKKANALLVKHVTGKTRASTFDLPPGHFVYGKRDTFDEEGVREVVGSWKSHVPNPESIPGRDFVRLNKSAVVKGATNSKDINLYRKHNDLRLRTGPNATERQKQIDVLDVTKTYGRPCRPSTPIHDVLCNNYQHAYLEDQAILRNTRSLQKRADRFGTVGKFAGSQHTRASLGHMKVQAPPPREPFKLAKFRHVQPRINASFSNSPTSYHGTTLAPLESQPNVSAEAAAASS